MSQTKGRLHIGIGGYTAQGMPLGPAAGVAQRDIVAHAELAEALGFDSLWLGEHHFSTDGYTAALFPLLGALAARTQRLVLGTRVLLAPLHPALPLAENAAQVALLAEGRFILGLGIGYREMEFDALRIPRRERAARLEEAIAVCRKAWTGEPFDHDGPTVNAHGLVCRPAPPVPPPIWLGGRARPALKRVAELGDGYVAPLGGADETAAAVMELDALTPPARGLLPITTGSFVLCGADAQTNAVFDRGITAVRNQYASWLSDEPGVYNQDTEESFGITRGTPEQVTELLLKRVKHHTDRDHHLALRVDYPGMTREQIEQHMRLLAAEVLPALRAAAAS